MSNPEDPRAGNFHISFSEYRSFTQCPFRHFLDYVLKVPQDKNENLIYGSATHNSIEYLTTNKIEDAKEWDDIFVEQLAKQTSKSYAKSYFGKKLVMEGRRSIRALDFWKRYEGYEIVEVELEIYEPFMETNGVTIYFKGFVDMILRKGDKYVIIDWKTANKAWDLSKKKKDRSFFGQVVLYKHFFSKIKNVSPNDIEVRFVTLPRDVAENIQTFNGDDMGVDAAYEQFILDDIKRIGEAIYNLDPLDLYKAKGKAGERGFPCGWCDHNQFLNAKKICDNNDQIVTINDF